MSTWIQEHRKAIVGAISTGAATLATSWADGNMTGAEWVAVFLSMLVGGGLVYQIPNAVTPPAPPVSGVPPTTRYDKP